MAYQDVAFPFYPSIHGVSKSVIDPVSISSNGAYEYRVKRSRWERYKWTIPTQTMTDEQKTTIKNFLLERRHALDSFRFADPEMPNLVDNKLSFNSSVYWNFNVHLSDGVPGTHPIFNTDITGLSATADGSPIPIDELTYISGQPVLGIPAALSSADIRISGPFYYTVRLASDFNSTILALDCNNLPLGHSVNAIELIEVFGEY